MAAALWVLLWLLGPPLSNCFYLLYTVRGHILYLSVGITFCVDACCVMVLGDLTVDHGQGPMFYPCSLTGLLIGMD